MDRKKQSKFFRVVFYACFLSFLTFYVAGESGYYEYNERKKMIFTKEQIERFESDVASGKNVDIGDYVIKSNNHQNKISKTTLSISEGISKYTKECISFIFGKIGSMIEDV